ncbi:MAG: flagellar hook-associated protein FlgK [Myxococcota bacterium]
MSLFSLLGNSAQSMLAHRGASATAQNNLQNVNTPGYSRQRGNLEEASAALLGGVRVGRGVNLTSISQARDRFIESRVSSTFGGERRAAAEAEALTGVSAFDLDIPGGVAPALRDFYSALRTLAAYPEEPGTREAVVGAAKGLQQAIGRAATDISTARRGVDAAIPAQVAEVNELSQQVAELNIAIRAEAGSGQAPNDLLDKRRLAADRLAELTGASPVPDASGDMNLLLPGGAALVVGDRTYEMSAEVDPGNGGYLALRLNGKPVDPRGLSGTLGGSLAARDGALLRTQEGLDQFAFDFASSLNAVNEAGFGTDGTTGKPLFLVSATATDAARQFEVNPDIEADPRGIATSNSLDALPGNNAGVLALLATEDAALSGGEGPAGTFATLAAAFGTDTKRALSVAEQEGALRARLEDLRASASSVSIDEEMVEMMKAQRAFEATSKVIQTVDEMLDTVMRLR